MTKLLYIISEVLELEEWLYVVASQEVETPSGDISWLNLSPLWVWDQRGKTTAVNAGSRSARY